MVAFQKRLPVMRGEINMICSKEWCTEVDQILHFRETFLAFPEGFHCMYIFNLILIPGLGKKMTVIVLRWATVVHNGQQSTLSQDGSWPKAYIQ